MTIEEIMAVPTLVPQAELERDVWDEDNRVNYSADGKYLTDAENFPEVVTVKEGCEVICDDVFAFDDYMAYRKIGEEIPLEERSSFLEKIHLPNSVAFIGDAAFAECGELLSIKLPTGLLKIGASAFMDCWQLEKISLPAKTRVIGPRAFQGCVNLYQVRLNKALEVIGEDAFDDCESLETIIIPHGMLDHFMRLLPKELHELLEEL
ncbi:MAG: leucine-rich repeat domain-containing protein [Bacteroidales bacterium]|nr:leucine-rich repeat domain-containing protein [Bacteroidales bacterium]